MPNKLMRWDLYMAFWMLWDIGFATKNLIEGDMVFLVVFTALSIIQIIMWKRMRPAMVEKYNRSQLDKD